MSEETSWFVIHATKDDSHCLVPKSDVICDHSAVAEGDEIKFMYGKGKKPIHGFVRGMGGECFIYFII